MAIKCHTFIDARSELQSGGALGRVSARNVWMGGPNGVGGLGVLIQEKKISFKFQCLKWPIWPEMTPKYGIYIFFFANKEGVEGSRPPPPRFPHPPGENPAVTGVIHR